MDTIMIYFAEIFSTADVYEQYALLAAAIAALGYLAYWYATVFGSTRPNRITWGVLSLVGFAIAVNYWIASNASPNAQGIAIVNFIGAFGTFVLSLRWGQMYGPHDSHRKKYDLVCLLFGIASIVLWQAYVWGFLKTDLLGIQVVEIALFSGIIADLFGLLPTIRKAWEMPLSESRFAWIVTVLGAVVGIFAIRDWSSLQEIIYPLYLVCVNGLVLAFLFSRAPIETTRR